MRVARAGLESAGELDAGIGHKLTRGQMLDRGIHRCLGSRGLVQKREGRRLIGAAGASEGARGNVLPGDTFGGRPGPPVQLGLQVDQRAGNDADLGAAHKAQRIALLRGILKLDGHLRIRKHALVLLISHGRTVRGEDVVPGRVPGRRFAGDVHSTSGPPFLIAAIVVTTSALGFH